MRYTKKMLMVPETEYLALINLIKGSDHLQNEKAMLEAKIHQNLYDPRTNEDLKAKKHAALMKTRRQLNKIIENKPQRVIVDNQIQIPNLPPYLGINKPVMKEEDPENPNLLVTRRKRFRQPEEEEEEEESTSAPYSSSTSTFASAKQGTAEDEDEEEESEVFTESGEYTPKKSLREVDKEKIKNIAEMENKGTPSKLPKIKLTPKKRKQLENYLSKNLKKYPITLDGKIIGTNKLPVRDSDFRKTLDHFEGNISSPPKGTYYLQRKLIKDPEVLKILGSGSLLQEGEGKRKTILLRVKPIKTPGIERIPKIKTFKPQLWARF